MRRRRRVVPAVGAALLVLLAAAVWVDHSAAGPGRSAGTGLWSRSCRLVGVIDAGTIEVERRGHTLVLSLCGVDADSCGDRGSPADRDSPAMAAAGMLQRLAPDRQLWFATPPTRPRDPAGRLLAYVYLPDGTMFNESLLAAGLARPDGAYRHRWQQRFELLAERARREQVGRWATGMGSGGQVPAPWGGAGQ